MTRPSRLLPLLLVALLLAAGVPALAQTTPRIESLFPAGGPRGGAVEVQVAGRYIPGPCRLTVSGGGVTAQETDVPGRYRFQIPPDAPLGACEVRLASVQGGSPPFPFLIGELPEVAHPGDDQPVKLTLPVTANGWLRTAGRIDAYTLELAAGDQVIAAAATRPLRSALDPTVRLLDAAGRVVAVSRPHRTADALLVYRAPATARYTLQVFDFQLAGGTEHLCRLTVTTGPWLDFAFPAGLPAGVATSVTLTGWNLPGAAADANTALHAIPAQPAGSYDVAFPGGANRLTLPVGPHPEALEAEPNDAPEQAQPVRLPLTLNGRLQTPGDVDSFSVELAQGDRLACDVQSADLDFPTDLLLTITNPQGQPALEVDDGPTTRDPTARFTAPAAGTYRISLRDRGRTGGPDCVYRLRLAAPQPDAAARVSAAHLTLAAGETVNLPVVVERLEGFTGELELTALGLPDGITVASQPVPATSPATIQLPFTAGPAQAPTGGLVQIVLRQPADAAWRRTAVVAETPTAPLSRALWVAVSPKVPFALKSTTTILDAPRLAAFPFPVTVERQPGFVGAIRLVGVEPDRRGTVVPLTGEIPASGSAGALPLVIQQHATEGTTHRSRVMGIADVPGADGRLYSVFHVAPGTLSVGCAPSWLTLAVDPPIQTWRPAETRQVEVRLMRRVEMGDVTLRLVPPAGAAGIRCEPVVVPPDRAAAVLTVELPADAAIPPRADWEIRAESARLSLPIQGLATFRVEAATGRTSR